MMVPKIAEDERDLALGRFNRRTGQLFRQTDAGSGKKGKKVIPFNDLMTLIQGLNEGRQSVQDLISPDEMSYRMFVSPARQLEMVRERNERLGWGFTDRDFVSLGSPPAWFTEPFFAVVLDVSLDDEFQTIEAAIECTKETYPFKVTIFSGLQPLNQYFRLIDGKEHQRGLRWQVVNLAAHWDRKGHSLVPFAFQNPQTSPGQVVFWAASYFPRWLQAMQRSGGFVPNVWITGYEIDVFQDRETDWGAVPNIHKDMLNQDITLFYGGDDVTCSLYQGGCWAIPELIIS